MNSQQLEQIALDAVGPNVTVNVWKHPTYHHIILAVTVQEDGDTATYENDEYELEVAAALAPRRARLPA